MVISQVSEWWANRNGDFKWVFHIFSQRVLRIILNGEPLGDFKLFFFTKWLQMVMLEVDLAKLVDVF